MTDNRPVKHSFGDFTMSKEQKEPFERELADVAKQTLLKRRENPVRYENREPTKKEQNKRFSLKRRSG